LTEGFFPSTIENTSPIKKATTERKPIMSTQTPETSRTINGITYTLGEEVLIEPHTCWERENKIEVATVLEQLLWYLNGDRVSNRVT
jgi:hypothetical protein